jgi:hypothetical protein
MGRLTARRDRIACGVDKGAIHIKYDVGIFHAASNTVFPEVPMSLMRNTHNDAKVHYYIFTAAASSNISVKLGWFCRQEAGMSGVMDSQKAL